MRPVDVVSTPGGDQIFVSASTNHKVMVYSRTGLLIKEWGGQGNNPGEFRYPATLAMSKEKQVYVVDVLNSRVQIFELDGKLVTVTGDWGVLPGQFFRPKGVAVDEDENIYVSDNYLEVVEVFDSRKRFSYVLGKDKNRVLCTLRNDPYGTCFCKQVWDPQILSHQPGHHPAHPEGYA